jgi:hypothetical protein
MITLTDGSIKIWREKLNLMIILIAGSTNIWKGKINLIISKSEKRNLNRFKTITIRKS